MKKKIIAVAMGCLCLVVPSFAMNRDGAVNGKVEAAMLASKPDLTMRNVFKTMPDSLMPLVSMNSRLDFFDFFDNHMPAVVKNEMGGNSEMTVLTDDYISVRLTDMSRMEMKLLPQGDSSFVICCVHTYGRQLKNAPTEKVKASNGELDSDIWFYTSDWKPLSANDFVQRPGVDDYWLEKADASQRAEASHLIEYTLECAELNPKKNTLCFYLFPQTVDKKSAQSLSKVLSPSVMFHWNGSAFVK